MRIAPDCPQGAAASRARAYIPIIYCLIVDLLHLFFLSLSCLYTTLLLFISQLTP